MDATPDTITATFAENRRTAAVAFHAPGCSHLRSIEVLSTAPRTLEGLRSLRWEAKALGNPDPIAPCLREALA